ncbi:MAG TPA: glycosyl transferase, partial [Actinomycetota bacterium]|nr:glycosyl transferase [Actinomycetota bacterium]
MRFLLARPDHLGDVLLTLPAASALKRAFPRSTVTYLVAPGSADAPALSADVDDALTVEFPAPNDGRPPPVEVVDRAARRLRGRFDAAV